MLLFEVYGALKCMLLPYAAEYCCVVQGKGC